VRDDSYAVGASSERRFRAASRGAANVRDKEKAAVRAAVLSRKENPLSAAQTVTDSHEEGDFPRSWNFDEDGDTVDGTYVELGEGPTAGYGYKPIITLDVAGKRRTVWVFHTSLAEKLRDELSRRKAQEFTVGERILIKRGERKVSETTGRKYVPYRVQFPDGPKRSAVDVLGAALGDQPEEQEEEEAADDGVPF
jgi:hypothetical protein